MIPAHPSHRQRLWMHLALAAMLFVPTARAEGPATLDRVYAAPARQLIAAALADDEGYADLAYLCDHIGNRISGSESLERAIAWSADRMKRSGLANVRLQPVTVPAWVRGAESATVIAPVQRPLHLLGLGMSIGTPAGGITADAVVVSSLDHLRQLGRDAVQGKVVVFNVPYQGYGETVPARVAGPSQAAALGAVAALVRSITPLALQTPHTGTLNYDPKQPRIPAAAISPEDAMMLARLASGAAPVRVHLDMQARQQPDAQSANVMAEIVGSSRPEEVVVLGGHIDSWDVGQGAHDDGSGVIAALSALRLIKKLGLVPRRTLRVVFWTNEENGAAGGAAYRKALGDDVAGHVAAIEMDGGAEAPVGFGYGPAGKDLSPGEQRSMELLRQIAVLLEPVGANTIRPGGGGTDIAPLVRDGVPGLAELTTMEHYFDWHHTEADTLDKVDPVEFRKNVAAMAVMAYVLADMPEKLAGRVAPPRSN